jgi:hypothetical protein
LVVLVGHFSTFFLHLFQPLDGIVVVKMPIPRKMSLLSLRFRFCCGLSACKKE